MRSVCSSAPSDSPLTAASGCSMPSSSARSRARTGPLPTRRVRAGRRSLAGFSLPPDAADQPQAPAGSPRRDDPLQRHVAEALALHVRRREARVHGDVGERGGLAGGVPAVDVVARVRLRVALGLRLRQRVVEGPAGAHRVDDEVGRPVEHRLEAEQGAVGECVLQEAEDGEAVHDGALEADAAAARVGRRRDLRPAPGDGSLVGGDHVHAQAERLEDVVRGRRPVRRGAGGDPGEVPHHRELHEDVRLGGGEQLGGRPGRLRRGRPVADRRERLRRRHAGRIEQAAVARAHGADQHAESVPVGEHPLLGGQQLAECPGDAAEPEQAELDRAGRVPSRLLVEAGQRDADVAGGAGRRGCAGAHRTERERSPTAATRRSSSPSVVYGASPTRTRPPRGWSPSSSTSRWA